MDLTETMQLTALCGLGVSTGVPVRTSIQNFRSAYLHHIDRDHCPVCSGEIRRKAASVPLKDIYSAPAAEIPDEKYRFATGQRGGIR